MDAQAEVVITNWGGLSCRFLNLLVSGDMFDIQIQVGAHLFDAHKLILCASSDVFKTMFTNRKWSEAHKETIKLVEEPVCESVFDRFIHYIYTGQLYLSHRTVCPLLTLADKYNVKELIPLCRKYMFENLDAPMDQTCVLQWWNFANLRNDVEMETRILKYIELNFNKIIESPDFLNASVETVEKLISNSKLVVCNELTIFCAVHRWIQAYVESHNPSFQDAKAIFSRLCHHIRWRLMTTDEIRWLHNNKDINNFIKQFSPEFCFCTTTSCFVSNCEALSCSGNLLHDFKAFLRIFSSYEKSCPQTSSNKSCASDKEKVKETLQERIANKTTAHQLLSRVYISDYWATELTIQDFSSFPRYHVQTFFFSTPKTGYAEDDGHNYDWEVELHPKGVHFPPAIMIGLDRDGSKLIDELFVDSVRLSVMSRSPQDMPLKVEVNIIVRANCSVETEGTYFERSHSRICFFEHLSQRHNFDDIVPLDNLGMYLQPHSSMFLSPTVAFSLCIVIRPLPM